MGLAAVLPLPLAAVLPLPLAAILSLPLAKVLPLPFAAILPLPLAAAALAGVGLVTKGAATGKYARPAGHNVDDDANI